VTELTPEDRDRIYQEEKARHEAREELELAARRKRAAAIKARQQRTVLGVVVGTVFVIVLFAIVGRSNPPQPVRSPQKVLEDKTKAEEGVEILRQGGVLIRLDADARRAYVDNGMWSRFPENTKADSAWALSVAMGIPSVEIHDARTGRHIGSYSRGGTYENLDLKP